MQAADQKTMWLDFYEGAWAARNLLIERLIAEGETHPFRLIKRLETFERRNIVKRDGEDRFAYEKNSFGDDELGPSGLPAFRIAALRGRHVVLSFHANACLSGFIIDFIEETGPYDVIVELGCGYGRNIFEIWYGGAPVDAHYFGGEYTESGVALARRLAGLDACVPAKFFHFDHRVPNLTAVPRGRRALVFTVHSLEQVRLIHPEWFAAAAGVADEVVGLNLEPFGFQVAELGETSRMQRAEFSIRGWNTNFVDALMAAREGGLVDLTYMATEMFVSNDHTNSTSLAVWRAPASAAR